VDATRKQLHHRGFTGIGEGGSRYDDRSIVGLKMRAILTPLWPKHQERSKWIRLENLLRL